MQPHKMANMIYHSYCKKRKDILNIAPLVFHVSDHTYSIKGTKKRKPPAADTHYIPSECSTYPNENILLGLGVKSKWSEPETALLLQITAETKLHSIRFWEKCAKELNNKFSTSRTGASCRLYFKRIKSGQPSSPQSQDAGCADLVKTNKDTSFPIKDLDSNLTETGQQSTR